MYFLFQNKYKEDSKKSLSQSIYSQLPETSDTQFARTISELQSEVTEEQDQNLSFSAWSAWEI